MIYVFCLCYTNVFAKINNNIDIQVNGVDKEILSFIKEEVSLFNVKTEEKLTSQRILNLYDLSDSQISNTLEAFGYYNYTIQKNIQNNDNAWKIIFNIQKGPQIKISDLKLKITDQTEQHQILLTKIYSLIAKYQKHLYFNHKHYEELKSDMLENLSNYGFFDGNLKSSQVLIDRINNTAVIYIIIEAGERYKFGIAEFESDEYNKELLLRFKPFKEGEYYDANAVHLFQQNLENSGYFSKIRLDIHSKSEQKIVSLVVRLSSNPGNTYTGSIGYGTDTRFRVGLGWHRIVSRQTGHKMNVNLKWSQLNNLISTSYIIPGQNAATDNYTFKTSIREDKRDRNKYSLKTDFKVSKQNTIGIFTLISGADFFQEKFKLKSGDPISTRKFLLATANLIMEEKEEHVKTTLSFKIGHKTFISDNNVFYLKTLNKKTFHLNDLNRISVKIELGCIFSDNFFQLPPSLRFFAGGDASVRGYRYKTLGPKQLNDTGSEVVIGGRYLITGSVEYERQIYKQFAGAIFFDMGNTFLDLKKIKMGHAIGVGLHYKTPIGSFNIDVATPLSFKSGKDFVFHLSFGADI